MEGLRTRDHHILEWLANGGIADEVLVVDRPVSIAERIVRRKGWHIEGEEIVVRGRQPRQARLTREHHGLFVLDQSAPALVSPLLKRRGWWWDAFEDASTISAIEWASTRAGPFDACIAWTPTVVPALKALGLPFVFDSLDNWLIHPAYAPWRAQTETAYEWLAHNARSLVVAAPASRKVFERWRDDVEVVPNGVDVEHFTEPHPRPADMPDPPVVGYAGKIGGRMDSELVAAVAAAMPETNFVMVGPVLDRRAIEPASGRSNVTFLGDRHYARLPAYVQAFDIAWIPHRVGEGETGGDLIKRYEYWAAGKQVLSTRIDGWEEWADSVTLFDTAATAESAIRRVLAGDVSSRVPPIPASRTWRSIAQQLTQPLTNP